MSSRPIVGTHARTDRRCTDIVDARVEVKGTHGRFASVTVTVSAIASIRSSWTALPVAEARRLAAELTRVCDEVDRG